MDRGRVIVTRFEDGKDLIGPPISFCNVGSIQVLPIYYVCSMYSLYCWENFGSDKIQRTISIDNIRLQITKMKDINETDTRMRYKQIVEV